MANGVALYSGIICVGKIHIPNLMGGHCRLSNIGNKLGSPFPRRSSLISPNCPQDVKFEDGVHLISPVGLPCNRVTKLMDASFVDTSFVGLKDAVGNKLILENGKQNYYMVTLPAPSTSPLGKIIYLYEFCKKGIFSKINSFF